VTTINSGSIVSIVMEERPDFRIVIIMIGDNTIVAIHMSV
jgi:hypothetical protein